MTLVLVPCPSGQQPLEAMAQSKMVFEGKVVGKRAVLARRDGWYFPTTETTFSVSRAWKGVADSQVTLLEEFNNCASRFSGGETYLVYASHHWTEVERFSSIKCSRTVHISRASNDLAVLGQPRFAGSAVPTRAFGRERLRIGAWWAAGLAVYGNLPRQLRRGRVSSNAHAIALAVVLSVILFLAGRHTLRRRRMALVLLVIVMCFIAVAILLEGYVALRENPYFSDVQRWAVKSGA